MKHIILITLLSIQMTWSAPLKLRVGTEGAYAPFNFIDKKGKLKGFDVDVAKAVCKEIKADCKFVTQAWDGIIPGLLYKKYDMIVASMSITKKRAKKVLFSDGYYAEAARFMVSKKSNLKKFDKASLKGKKIGVQKATTHLNYLEGELKNIVTIREYDTQEQAHMDLQAGRVDAVIAATSILFDWMKKYGKNKFELRGPVMTDSKYFGLGAGIAFRKKDKELVGKVNLALQKMKKDGRLNKMWRAYFPFDVSL